MNTITALVLGVILGLVIAMILYVLFNDDG